MVDAFCNSHFSYQEKRDLFFPEKPVICRTCHHPRVKKKIDLGDFSANHQNMICMFGGPHGGAAAGVPHGGAAANETRSKSKYESSAANEKRYKSNPAKYESNTTIH